MLLSLWLVTASGAEPAAAHDQAAAGETDQLYSQPVLNINLRMHTGKVMAAAVDRSHTRLFTVSLDKSLRIWTLADGKLEHTLQLPRGPGEVGKMYTIASSPTEDLLALAGWGFGFVIYLIDPNTAAIVRTLPAGASTNALAFSPDGTMLTGGLSDGSVVAFTRKQNWAALPVAAPFADDHAAVTDLAFSPATGKLVVAGSNGELTQYAPNLQQARHVALKAKDSGGLDFSPDGSVLALASATLPSLLLLNGDRLSVIASVDATPDGDDSCATDCLSSAGLAAWSSDGATLYSGGYDANQNKGLLMAWDKRGRGERRQWMFGASPPSAMLTPPGGQLLAANADPVLALFDAGRRLAWQQRTRALDMSNQAEHLRLSNDGSVVEFPPDPEHDDVRLRFDAAAPALASPAPGQPPTALARTTGLAIDFDKDPKNPLLKGKPLDLWPGDQVLSLAIAPDAKRFVFGSSFEVQANSAKGELLWRTDTAAATWAVVISGDGRLLVAAFGDGTLRWYRLSDGHELLALMPLIKGDAREWVAWTPEGFYADSERAERALQWLTNRGSDRLMEAVPVSAIPGMRRPEVLAPLLRTLDMARAIGLTKLGEARQAVQQATQSESAPGARLSVLTIGLNKYGDKAKGVPALQFAIADAKEVLAKVGSSQGSGEGKHPLYADVWVKSVLDTGATKVGIIKAFDLLDGHLSSGSGDNVAIVLFSGHGAIVDGGFYLLPYDVNDNSPADLQASGMPVEEVNKKLDKLARHGKVIVLLDACRSGAAFTTADGRVMAGDPDLLRAQLSHQNVTVITSSSGKQDSQEHALWQHGALTKVFLDGLGGKADVDHDGLISMAEMKAYLQTWVPRLTKPVTAESQHVGIEEHDTDFELFVTAQ